MRPVQERWARERLVAQVYDTAIQHEPLARIGARALWGFDVRLLFAELDRVAELAPGLDVLDVPTGGGIAFRALRPGHGLHYVAADISPAMLARARAQAVRQGLDGIELVEADATALPFGDAGFDVVLSFTGLHCFAAPEAALKEMRRVLRPGGTLRLTTVVRGAGRRHELAIALLRRMGIFGRVGHVPQLREWLAAAGFDEVVLVEAGAFAVVEAR